MTQKTDCQGCYHNRAHQQPSMTFCDAHGKPEWVVPAPLEGQCKYRIWRGEHDEWADEDDE